MTRSYRFWLALTLVALALSAACRAPAPAATAVRSGPAPDVGVVETSAAPTRRSVVENVAIRDYGKVVFRGTVDLSETIARIEAGERHPHRNDGAVFQNRERRLPRRPRGYYHEYVHPTPGIGGPGPQRIVVGADGDWHYTPDHYATFIPLQ